METASFHTKLKTLIQLKENKEPLISCYLQGPLLSRIHDFLDSRLPVLRKTIRENHREFFDQALSKIKAYLHDNLHPSSKGIALFSRGGREPFFMAFDFQVPLTNSLIVDKVPHVYQLVELKDTYHRYVVILAHTSRIRILEVQYGEIILETIQENPALCPTQQANYSKESFRRECRERVEESITDSISFLSNLMGEEYEHIILAGDEDILVKIREAMPEDMKSKIVDSIVASEKDPINRILQSTNESFVEFEEDESEAKVMELEKAVHRHGLYALGTEAVMQALHDNRVDFLILAKDFKPHPKSSYSEKLREEIIKLAEENNCGIEIVVGSDWLQSVGGVGCLLCYQEAK